MNRRTNADERLRRRILVNEHLKQITELIEAVRFLVNVEFDSIKRNLNRKVKSDEYQIEEERIR